MKFFPCFLFILLLFSSGCMTQQDLYGVYGTGKPQDQLTIITPRYILTVPAEKWREFQHLGINSAPYKSNYTLQKLYNGYYIKSCYWFRLRKFLFLPYEDATVWFLGFIPIDGIHIVFFPKLSQEKALQYLEKRNLDYEKIQKLSIINTIDNRYFLIPDDSLPDIMTVARKLQEKNRNMKEQR